MDLNRRPLELEVTALPTEPQPLPYIRAFYVIKPELGYLVIFCQKVITLGEKVNSIYLIGCYSMILFILP